MENKSIEGNIYTNNKTGILHLVVKDNFKDNILGDKKNNIILRSLDKLNLNS